MAVVDIPGGGEVRVESCTINIGDEIMADLRARLAGTRWPAPLPVAGWQAGTEPGYLRELVRYWREDFDWPAWQRCLNSFPHFTAGFEGTRIHFVHQRGAGPQPLPLVLTHGWPSCFTEMLRLVPLLTDPGARRRSGGRV